jgi:hypothetical protein
MLSFATRAPKRFVIPRNSSCSAASLENLPHSKAVPPGHRLRSWPLLAYPTRPSGAVPRWHHPGTSLLQLALVLDYTGLFVGVGILPLMIPALMVLIWFCNDIGILLAKSW